MGADKALLDWHGRTFLARMLELVSSVTPTPRVIGRQDLPDSVPESGPLGGIATALEVSETDANLIVAVDLPCLTEDFLKYFRSRIEMSNHPLLACTIGGRYPLCLGVHRSLLPLVHQRLNAGLRSIYGLVLAADSEMISEAELKFAGFESSLFRNVNRPEDYRHT